jgi:hypothetical protein
MTPEVFVDSLKRCCRDSAVIGCVQNLEAPPGRKPNPALVKLSVWYNNLSPEDKANVAAAMQEAADATLFGVLCVIDGVRTIEPGSEKSEFRLSATRLGVVSTIAPGPEFLHDILLAEP